MTNFSDYERVTDTLLFLSDQIVLEFTVMFATKDKFDHRVFFHTETEYTSNKYNDVSVCKGIKRRMLNFYFVLSDKKTFDNSFIFRYQDVYVFKTMIEQRVIPWFIDPKERIFAIMDNKLVINKEFVPVDYVRNEYQFIRLTPIVITYEDGTFKEGIRLYLNSESTYVDLDIDKFLGFYYVLANTDMYNVACNIATYTKVPPYDINVWKRTGLAGGNIPTDDSIWNSSENKVKKVNNFFNNQKKKEQDN